MAIDKKPAVGRIILTGSTFTNGFADRGGKITKISGKRIYYQTKNGTRYCSNFAAVCDTIAEEEQLLQFSRTSFFEIRDLRNRQNTEWEKFFTK